MGLRISTNVPAQNMARTLDRFNWALSRRRERQSSGLGINRGADDAAGLAIPEGIPSQVRGAQAAQRKVPDGISRVPTADGALSETATSFQCIRALSLQVCNGTQRARNRASLNTEVQEVIAQLEDIAREPILIVRNQIRVNAGVNVLARSNVLPQSALNCWAPGDRARRASSPARRPGDATCMRGTIAKVGIRRRAE